MLFVVICFGTKSLYAFVRRQQEKSSFGKTKSSPGDQDDQVTRMRGIRRPALVPGASSLLHLQRA